MPFDTISIAIPFYLARPELTALHAEKFGHVEGIHRADILRYLRHEMGHVVNYAYRLYDDERWVKRFGSITQPYVEEYRPEPFSRRFVRHLPGWYAQKHPDEDWAETFAVWMTAGLDWQSEYAEWPEALAKLEYCDETMKALSGRDPLVTAIDHDEDVGDLSVTLDDWYGKQDDGGVELPRGLDGALKAIFEDLDVAAPGVALHPASGLIARIERELIANVFRWTGHFPERTRPLLRHIARRCDELHQGVPEAREREAVVAVTTLVTALALNYTLHGRYLH